ncbi:outer membrane protein assembly factor BamC [Marinimicrobium sp. ABcell2]|uniref:outer membrane protein assembly factor BamC n=1 Tax=Marinimicrobium sp. ABcell2 TaxID=3069751 RepID=UPI0027B64C48|nr:outer membrane protein assembly factor BamC [Marinimicrobium sp. ABcell2]MDQ2078308.1 outer membrane protein assembly factor BamC [Marinimicrobium sp. ABcell2]
MTIMTVKQTRFFYGVLAAFSLTLTGCGVFFGDDGYFRNREDDYLKADSLAPLKVPPHLNSEAPGELYVVPPLTDDDLSFVEDTDRFRAPRPRALAFNAMEERVRIQRLGDDQWILVNVQPGQVWPQVSNFLSSNQLRVARTDINQGILETGWISFNEDPDEVHRFQLRIDRGVQPDSSEIHVVHMGMSREEAAEATGWPSRSISREREHWLVEELAQNLASEQIAAVGGTSLVAQAIGGSAKSDLSMRDGEPVLTLLLNRERALANLSHATQQQGFTTLDSKVSAGVIYVAYQKPETRERGRFARLFGLNKPKPTPTSPYRLEQLLERLPEPYDSVPEARASEAERARPDAPGYLLVLSFTDNGVEARMRDPYGRKIAPRRARELLTIVRQNLI